MRLESWIFTYEFRNLITHQSKQNRVCTAVLYLVLVLYTLYTSTVFVLLAAQPRQGTGRSKFIERAQFILGYPNLE